MVLDLHRSAGNLDENIRMLEIELEQHEHEDEYSNIFIRQVQRYRADTKTHREYDKLDEKENDIWQQLIDAVKQGEAH